MQFGPVTVSESPLCSSMSLVLVTKPNTSIVLKVPSAISDCTACPLDRKCPDCTVYSRALSRDTQLHGIAPTDGARGQPYRFACRCSRLLVTLCSNINIFGFHSKRVICCFIHLYRKGLQSAPEETSLSVCHLQRKQIVAVFLVSADCRCVLSVCRLSLCS